MEYGFIKVAAASPALRVADCEYNAGQIISAMQKAEAQGVRLLCLPELCITGYTCGDLFQQQSLLQGALLALRQIAQASETLQVVTAVGLPFVWGGKLYNCAAVVQRGQVLGLVPKTCLPNYAEFHEMRYFCAALPQNGATVWNGQEIPFGTKLLFQCSQLGEFCFAVELCEDLWAPVPPSCRHALAGATIIANLSASDETVGKADYRSQLVAGQSARLLCGYVYADACAAESTTDLVFAAHDLVAENGSVLAQSLPFGNGFACSEVDVQRLTGERRRCTTFGPLDTAGYQTISFAQTSAHTPLTRPVSPAPFVPGSQEGCDARCELIFSIQAHGLAKRLQHAHARTAVLGISGGLDSSLALLVCVRAFQLLGRPTQDILAVTMPCFGTTKRTRSNAQLLCEQLDVAFRQVDISATVRSHFQDIGQPEGQLDVTFENAQARVRTLVLMDLANQCGGLVVGTGDLSELALGWATYNGDHMSMYGVNAGVPKTLVRHIVHYEAQRTDNAALRAVLLDILDTPVSPELLPADKNGQISQQTEQLVGPYELHDFYLYYVLRFGFSPRKILYLAKAAFGARYGEGELLHWLKNFYRRFFAQQFKRSCLPDGPKVGSVSLSPRGDWRMPSDANAALWLKELEELEQL